MHLRKKVLIVDGLMEVMVAVNILTANGGDGCHVGFAPRHLVPHILEYDGALARVKEVYSCHDKISRIKRGKVHHNHGFAVAELVLNWQKKKKEKKRKILPRLPWRRKLKKMAVTIIVTVTTILVAS